MWRGHESNPGHLTDKQRHIPPQGPITPSRNLRNKCLQLKVYSLMAYRYGLLCHIAPAIPTGGPSSMRSSLPEGRSHMYTRWRSFASAAARTYSPSLLRWHDRHRTSSIVSLKSTASSESIGSVELNDSPFLSVSYTATLFSKPN